MARKRNSRSKFAEAIDPRFTGVVQTLKNEAKISNVPKKFFRREVYSDNNEAFQNYLRKRYYDYMKRNIEYVVLPPEQQRNKWEFPKVEEVELLNGLLIPLHIEKKPEPPPNVPILHQNSVIEENNGQDATPKKKKKAESPPDVPILPQNSDIEDNNGQEAPPKKKKTGSPPDVPILPQNSDIEDNNGQEAPKKKKKKKTESAPCVPDEVDAPPKKKRKKEKVCKNKITFESDEAFQEHLRKQWYDFMKSKIEYVVLPPEQQRNKWEFPKIEEVELLNGLLIPLHIEKKPEPPPDVPILRQNSVIEENNGQEATQKKKAESPPDVPILPQNSDIEENNGQEAPPKKKKKKKMESAPCVPILPQNSIEEEDNEVDAPPKKKRKKEKVCKNKITFESDEAFQEHLRKQWYDFMKSKIEYVVLPPEQQRNKWEFPKIEEVEILPGVPIIPEKEEKDGQEAPPKKKRKKEKKKEKECFKDVAVTAEWLEKQAKLYIS